MKAFITLAAAMFVAVSFTSADADEKPVKIGVLNDQNSVYSVDGGPETVVAVRMAAEDAGLVLGQPVEVVAADHQNKPDIGYQSPGNGTTSMALTPLPTCRTRRSALACRTCRPTRRKSRCLLAR